MIHRILRKPSISIDSTSVSKVQLLTFVQKIHANSEVTPHSIECSNVMQAHVEALLDYGAGL